jgi:hypothetical protein
MSPFFPNLPNYFLTENFFGSAKPDSTLGDDFAPVGAIFTLIDRLQIVYDWPDEASYPALGCCRTIFCSWATLRLQVMERSRAPALMRPTHAGTLVNLSEHSAKVARG